MSTTIQDEITDDGKWIESDYTLLATIIVGIATVVMIASGLMYYTGGGRSIAPLICILLACCITCGSLMLARSYRHVR